MSYCVAEQCIAPANGSGDGLSVRVREQLVRIEAVTVFWGIRTVCPITVELRWACVWQVHMPNMVGLLRQGNAIDLLILIRAIKESEIDARCIFREEGQVDSIPIPGGTEGIRLSRPDVHKSSVQSSSFQVQCLRFKVQRQRFLRLRASGVRSWGLITDN